ncbi:hypothetical protein HYY69_07460 [Candidatus Woesearchaeota archaeon]|nr:hypothetical protein [Candidatus Woesearchaeota archaeon]
MSKRALSYNVILWLIVLLVGVVAVFSVYNSSLSYQGYMVKGMPTKGISQVQVPITLEGCSDSDVIQKNYKNFPLNKFQYVNLKVAGTAVALDGNKGVDTCISRSGPVAASGYVKEYYCRVLPKGSTTIESLIEECKNGCSSGACK